MQRAEGKRKMTSELDELNEKALQAEHRSRRGQVSTEYLILLTVSLTLTIILAAIAYQSTYNTQEEHNAYVSRTFLDTVYKQGLNVYMQGGRARTTFTVELPYNINGSFIFYNSSSNELAINTSSAVLVETFDYPFNGTALEQLSHGGYAEIQLQNINGVVTAVIP